MFSAPIPPWPLGCPPVVTASQVHVHRLPERRRMSVCVSAAAAVAV
jgi:hypothetical protein